MSLLLAVGDGLGPRSLGAVESVAYGPDVVTPGTDMTAGVEGLFGLVLVLFIGGAIFSAIVGFRKYRILKDAGADPFTVDAAVAAKVLRSDVLRPSGSQEPEAPARSLEERLKELDDLLARGIITPDEHREARAAALRG